MVYSMTGYGKGNLILNGKDITVEVKSVNHRYFEYSSRMSRFFTFLDDKIKKETQSIISRGKVEVSLMIRSVAQSETEIQPDLLLAQSYYDALRSIDKSLGIYSNVDAVSIARFEGVLTQVKNEDDAQGLWLDVNRVLHLALDEFVAMRKVEGEKLHADILSRLDFIEQTVKTIESVSPLRTEKYRERLYTKLQSILQDTQIDQSRILSEAAIFADKSAVDEETTRLFSHIEQYRTILSDNVSQGRKLDFLTQELNREANTIGSKSNDLDITRMVVEIKAEIEKIREQIQNIE
ncbi:MAG: YicC/YloC family endoribonuclease [Oscillospiraceae bacterium]